MRTGPGWAGSDRIFSLPGLSHFRAGKAWCRGSPSGDQEGLLEQLFTHYERLAEDLRAELPLQRIRTVAA